MKIKLSLLVLSASIALSGCGGGGESPSVNSSEKPVNEITTEVSSWTKINEDVLDDPMTLGVLGMERLGDTIYISYNNVFTEQKIRLTKDGVNFTEIDTAPYGGNMLSFVDETGYVYMGSRGVIDGSEVDEKDAAFGSFASAGGERGFVASVVGSRNQLRFTFDGGNSFHGISLGREGAYSYFVSVFDPAYNGHGTVIAAAAEPAFPEIINDENLRQPTGLFVTNDSGLSWSLVEDGRSFEVVAGNSLYPNVFYATSGQDIYKSDNQGVSWSKSGEMPTEVDLWLDLELADDGELVAWYVPAGSNKGQVYSSSDSASWNKVGTPIGSTQTRVNQLANLEVTDDYYFVSNNDSVGIYTLKK